MLVAPSVVAFAFVTEAAGGRLMGFRAVFIATVLTTIRAVVRTAVTALLELLHLCFAVPLRRGSPAPRVMAEAFGTGTAAAPLVVIA